MCMTFFQICSRRSFSGRVYEMLPWALFCRIVPQQTRDEQCHQLTANHFKHLRASNSSRNLIFSSKDDSRVPPLLISTSPPAADSDDELMGPYNFRKLLRKTNIAPTESLKIRKGLLRAPATGSTLLEHWSSSPSLSSSSNDSSPVASSERLFHEGGGLSRIIHVSNRVQAPRGWQHQIAKKVLNADKSFFVSVVTS
jgi:hypothetical protein